MKRRSRRNVKAFAALQWSPTRSKYMVSYQTQAEKLVVTATNYIGLMTDLSQARAELDILRADLAEVRQSHAATIDRVSRIEAAAVHKGAVQDLVAIVQAAKDEITALKANLGWSRPTVDPIAALNGELIHGE